MRQAELFFTDSGGEGEAVLLAHALGSDHRLWDGVGERLSKRHRVIAMDARGHGRSPVPPRPYTLEMMADDACGVLEKLGLARAHWVGLSMGGMVGQAFALRHPARLNKLVIANSTAGYGADGAGSWKQRIKTVEEQGLAALRQSTTERWFSEGFRKQHPDLIETIMERFGATSPQGYLGACDAILQLDYGDDLVRIRARTLVIAGEADKGTPPEMSQHLAGRIPGARLAIIPGVAHLSAAEAPDAFADLVEEFLAG